MECKGALKLRWTAKEVAMLVEEWAKVCATPESNTLKSDDQNKAIFERYNTRCAQMRETRRSPNAVITQRDRMVRFARFVSEFDLSEVAQGRRAWFDLSSEEQLEFEITNEWRRQLTTFTLDIWNTFKRFILPAENGYAKRTKTKKLGIKHKKISSESTGKQQQVITRTKHQPCWTLQEKVLLAHQWTKFMKHEDLTLEAFDEMTYNKSCKCLASSTRSSFSAWRKSRILVSSWRFISAFNAQHQPGWFKLTEIERDLLITWGELPDNFEDIEREVFIAIEEAVLKYTTGRVKESNPAAPPPGPPPAPKALSPLQPTPIGLTPLLTDLCPKDVRTKPAETDDTLDRLLLEDDSADNVAMNSELQQPDTCVIETLGGNDFDPDACIILIGKTDGMVEAPVIKQEIVSGPLLDLASIAVTESTIQALESTLQTHTSRIQQALRQLETTLAQGNKYTQESIRAMKHDRFSSANAAGLSKYMGRVLEQQNRRLLSVLRLAEETCSQNDVDMQSLLQEFLGNGLDSRHNGTTGLDVGVHVTAPSD